MTKSLRVHLLPDLANPHELAGNVFVIIDVLRASTTIAHAIQAGIQSIVPCLEVSEARNLAKQQSVATGVLLGGERLGQPIPGFDFGNSPAEYTHDRVAGKRLIFTTTNGTRAMMRCIGAHRVLIGSFVNMTSVANEVRNSNEVELVCAGTSGEITREDVLFAGALASRLRAGDPTYVLDDSARLACDAWNSIGGESVSPRELSEQLEDTQGGRNLAAIDRLPDIELSAQIDAVTTTPELFLSDWQIRAANRDSSLP